MPFPIIYSLFKSIQFQGGLPSNSPFSIQSPKTIFTEVSSDIHVSVPGQLPLGIFVVVLAEWF